MISKRLIETIVTVTLIIFVLTLLIYIIGSFVIKPQAQDTGITIAAVQSHNTASDCYVIVNKKIYDITKLIPEHPRADQRIVPLCGKDATEIFSTRGENPPDPHPQEAEKILETFFISELE